LFFHFFLFDIFSFLFPIVNCYIFELKYFQPYYGLPLNDGLPKDGVLVGVRTHNPTSYTLGLWTFILPPHTTYLIM
jgi:hypothetical protein